MGNISSIIDGLSNNKYPVYESLGDRDVVTVSFSRMAIEIEKKLMNKYERQLESVGTEPSIDVYVRTEDDNELGIGDILDNISVNIYFEESKFDSKTSLNKIKQIFKKYSFADFRYSKKDDSYFIETFGQFDSFDFIEALASDGINLTRFYNIITGSQIDKNRYEDAYLNEADSWSWKKLGRGWLVQEPDDGILAYDSPRFARNTDFEEEFMSKFGKDLETIGSNPKVESLFHFYSDISRDSLDDVRFTVTFDSFNDDGKSLSRFIDIFSEYKGIMNFDKTSSYGNRRVAYIKGNRNLKKFCRLAGFNIRYPSSSKKGTDGEFAI